MSEARKLGAKKFVRGLLKGSDRINEMRQEIGRLSGMICSSIPYEQAVELGLATGSITLMSLDNLSGWRFEISGGSYFLQCFVQLAGPSTERLLYNSVSSNSHKNIDQIDVRFVRESFDEFILHLIAYFPVLEETWKPFLDVGLDE